VKHRTIITIPVCQVKNGPEHNTEKQYQQNYIVFRHRYSPVWLTEFPEKKIQGCYHQDNTNSPCAKKNLVRNNLYPSEFSNQLQVTDKEQYKGDMEDQYHKPENFLLFKSSWKKKSICNNTQELRCFLRKNRCYPFHPG